MKSFELFKLTEEISKEFMLDSVLWTLVVTLMKICRKRSNMIKEKIFVERKGTRKYNGTKSKDNRIRSGIKGIVASGNGGLCFNPSTPEGEAGRARFISMSSNIARSTKTRFPPTQPHLLFSECAVFSRCRLLLGYHSTNDS